MSARKLFNIRAEQIYNTAPSFTACSTNYDFLDTYWFFIRIIDILHLDNVSLLHIALNNLFRVKKSNLNFHANFESNWVICKIELLKKFSIDGVTSKAIIFISSYDRFWEQITKWATIKKYRFSTTDKRFVYHGWKFLLSVGKNNIV